MNELAIDQPGRRAVAEVPFRENALSPVRYAVGAMWSKRWLASAVALAILAVVLAFALSVPRHYAEAMLVVHPDHNNPAQPVDTQASSTLPDSSAVDTEVEILRSPAVAQAVVRKLKLYKDPEFGGDPSADASGDAFHSATQAILNGAVIRRVGLTYAVQVGFIAHTTDTAMRIANAIVAAYLDEKMNEKLATITRANHDLGAALAGLRDQALKAEDKVEQYVAANGLLNSEGTSLTEGELSALNQKIADAQADAAEREARVNAAMAQAEHGGGGSDVGATLASNTVGELRQKEAEASATLAQLQTQFRADYPLVQKTQAQLNDIRSALRSETGRILSSLKADARAAEQREASLLASRTRVEATIANSNRARVGLLALRQSADSAKTIYETYLKRASEVTAERGLQQADATVESRAIPKSDSPFSSMRIVLIGGIVLAGIGAILAVLFSDLWSPRIRSLRELWRETGLPLAGVVPDVALLGRVDEPANHVVDNPLTMVAESYRNLGAYLTVAGSQDRSRSVTLLTSAVPGEGKTMASICLARTLAARGSRVVLLDCDLRRASASKFFPKPQYGIAEIMERGVSIDQALLEDRKSRLHFIAGTATHKVLGDIFTSKKFDALLSQLSERFDHIVIDSPPLLGAADARILAAKADQVLYLVEWDKTPASVVRAAMEILRQCNARVSGVVLNKVNVRQQALYGFADGSDYYYRYGSYGQAA